MAGRFDRIDGLLGRLFFRAIGLLCGLIALLSLYAVFWHLTHWNAEYSLYVSIMFGLVAIAGLSVIPYCFSRNRTFGEALDTMEGGSGGDQRRR
jgi:hypothetical protein